MSDFPHVNAAFINAIAEEGTKADAVQFLQKQWNETCALRERLEQAERERDEWKDAAKRSHEEYYAGGFRAGIEAAAERVEKLGFTAQFIRDLTPTDKPCKSCNGNGYTDAVIDDRCGRCNETGVEPSTDNTPTVAQAAKVICDAWDADTLPVNDPDPMLPSFIAALRALAAQGDK